MYLSPFSADYLRTVLSYSRKTGILTWRWRVDARPNINARQTGKPAGSINSAGYMQIGINRKLFLAHRLAWLHVTGEWPHSIDHINGNRIDNRWINLRLATHTQNMHNRGAPETNSSGFKGVYRRSDCDRWCAMIGHDKKVVYLGLFKTAEEAHRAYCEAAKRLHGPFAKTR